MIKTEPSQNVALTSYQVDKVDLKTGEISETHTVNDRNEWFALMQVTCDFHDAYGPAFFGEFGLTIGDLRVQDLDDQHFWMVTWDP